MSSANRDSVLARQKVVRVSLDGLKAQVRELTAAAPGRMVLPARDRQLTSSNGCAGRKPRVDLVLLTGCPTVLAYAVGRKRAPGETSRSPATVVVTRMQSVTRSGAARICGEKTLVVSVGDLAVDDLDCQSPTHPAHCSWPVPSHEHRSVLKYQRSTSAITTSLQTAEQFVRCRVLRDPDEHQQGRLQPVHEDVRFHPPPPRRRVSARPVGPTRW